MTLRDKLKFWILLSNYIQMVVRGTSPLSLPDALDDKLLDLKAYGDCESRNLPEGYQELEYIEGNSANQYINTGIVPTSSMEYYAKCAVLDRISNSFPVFGARASNGGNDGIGAFVGSGANTRIDSFFFTAAGTEYRWQLDNVNTYGDIYEITFKNALQEVVKNGTSIGTKQYTPTSTCDKPLYVGSLNNGGALQAGEWTYRFYRFTITGIADMRPARRLSDGVLGMYDTIRKQFYTNAGTGSFIAGAPLTLPEGYTRIEYIEGNNNLQYINTGIVPTSSMSMYFKGQFVSVDASTPTQVSFLAGARDVGGQYGFFLQLSPTNIGLDWFVVNGRWTENNTRANGDIVEMRVNNSLAQMWLNGTSVGTHQYTPDDTTQYPLFLNGLNSVGQPFSNFNSTNRIYRFTIDGVADFVPARRDSDGAIGMFNVLNNQFYGNAGTGTFTAGSVIAPTPSTPQDIWCNNGAIKAIRPIKYLESTGTQYIDTGLLPTLNTKLVVKATRIAVGGFAGSRDGADANSIMMAFATNGTSVIIDFNNGNNVPYRINYTIGTGIITIIAESSKDARRLYDENGILLAENTTVCSDTFTATKNMTLFNCNGGSISGGCRIYYAQIWDGDTLIRDMIPALDANNIPCMFDKVEGKCYYNAGTGQFIAGYLPADYEELEYIQGYCSDSSDSTIKAAYIDTGIILPANVNFYLKSQLASSPTTNSYLMCGTRTTTYAGSEIYVGSENTVIDWYGSAESDRLTINNGGSAGDIYEIYGNNKTLTVFKNGSNIGYKTFSSPTTPTLTFWLNSRNTNNQVTSQTAPTLGRIYRFTVAGVCDMIPARKRSNGHIGMYDLVRRQFFENAGEGQFTFGKLPVLPDGYTQLEYLESTGTQYIDTGVVPNQDTSVELDGSIDGYGIFFGVRTAALVDISTIQGTSTGYWAMGYNTSADAIGTKDSNRHVWFKNKNLQYMDGELKNNYTYANFTAMGNAYLFAYNNNGTVGYVINGRVRIYSCKIWATADSVLVRHMIPAKRNSDGVVGMYDIMNDVFLTNQGTGDFVYGSEIPTETFDGYYVDGDVETIATKAGGSTLSTATCENLLGTDSTQDVQEILTGEVTRKVAVWVFNGTESWSYDSTYKRFIITTPKQMKPGGTRATPLLSTHFDCYDEGGAYSAVPNNQFYKTGQYLHFKTTDWAGVTQWTAWLRQQYDNGTPVIVVYPLAADETESVAGQTLTVSAGNNTAEIIQASIDGLEIEAKYLKRM